MEQQGKPISELLNSVAIIQQELQNCQDPAKEIELLGELKLLAARIYIETDFAMLSMGEFAEEIHEFDTDAEDAFSSDDLDLLLTEEGNTDLATENEEAELALGISFEETAIEDEQPVPDLFSMGSFMPEPVSNEIEIADNLMEELDGKYPAELHEQPVIETEEEMPIFDFELSPVVETSTPESFVAVDSLSMELSPEAELAAVVENTPVFEASDIVIDPSPVMEKPSPEIEPKVLEIEPVIPSVIDHPISIVEPPIYVAETPISAPAPTPPNPVVEPPTGEMPPPALPGMNVEAIINQMPISRRFEFANMLFGGDVQRMGAFIHELLQSPSGSARMDIYERWYEENNWRRRDEAASDLLRLIKRVFPS